MPIELKTYYTTGELETLLRGLRGKTAIYEDLRLGRIRSTRVGRKYVISGREVGRILGLNLPDDQFPVFGSTIEPDAI